MRLTDISVRALKASSDYKTYFDDLVPAFGVRVGKRRKTFVIVRGKKRERTTIGHFPTMKVGDARAKAKKLLANEPEPKAARMTWEKARDEFLVDNYRDSTSAWPGLVKLMLTNHFKRLDERQLGSITDEDIRDALDAIEGPSARVHAFRVARTFLRWATKPPRRYIRHSPMEGYDPPGTDKKRSRILTDDELVAIWNASGGGSRRVFRLIILWGTRSKETAMIARAWARAVEGSNESVMVIPGFEDGKRVTKNGRDHAIPLLTLAAEVLEASPPGDFYFPGQRTGPIRAGSLHDLRREIQAESGVKNWGAHDLRRTFRSNMPRLGVPKDLSEILLNHAPQALDEIYDRYTYLAEKRGALAKYEAFLLKLLRSGKQPELARAPERELSDEAAKQEGSSL